MVARYCTEPYHPIKLERVGPINLVFFRGDSVTTAKFTSLFFLFYISLQHNTVFHRSVFALFLVLPELVEFGRFDELILHASYRTELAVFVWHPLVVPGRRRAPVVLEGVEFGPILFLHLVLFAVKVRPAFPVKRGAVPQPPRAGIDEYEEERIVVRM